MLVKIRRVKIRHEKVVFKNIRDSLLLVVELSQRKGDVSFDGLETAAQGDQSAGISLRDPI